MAHHPNNNTTKTHVNHNVEQIYNKFLQKSTSELTLTGIPHTNHVTNRAIDTTDNPHQEKVANSERTEKERNSQDEEQQFNQLENPAHCNYKSE